MTLRKISILSAAVIIAVTGMVQAAVTPLLHVTIEYEYARDGEIVSRTVNGKVQRYAYDRRGQLTGIYDANDKAVEAYTYDAAGNILKKTINGKTTTFTYDAANQLVSERDDAGTTSYEYDAAGRMIREGDKEYRYSYLDKITSVIENGETAATMDYFVGGQLASVTRGHEIERFIWDGLALVHRDGSDYLNEPAVGGGNPIASGGQVMFNDMLGSTVAVKGDENYSLTSMTAFGESSDTGAFFTGKPFIGEIGYAFLMRSYRPEHGKWQTADPIGYPDGWNNLAYCNNHVMSSVDLFGCAEWFLQYMNGLGTESASCLTSWSSSDGQYKLEISLTVHISLNAMDHQLVKRLWVSSTASFQLYHRDSPGIPDNPLFPPSPWTEVKKQTGIVMFHTGYEIDNMGSVVISGHGTRDSSSESGFGILEKKLSSVVLAQVVPGAIPAISGSTFYHNVVSRGAFDIAYLASGISYGIGGLGLSINFDADYTTEQVGRIVSIRLVRE